jgi:CheY-like chemotaxis protein
MLPKVLLVDDVNMFLEIQKGFLNRSPVHVLTARDGAQAYDIIRKERPALVFMDLHMPVMNGAECCARLKGDPELRRLPVIMITAEGKEDDRQLCIEAGCDDFLAKPLDRTAYLAKARKYLPSIERRDERVFCQARVTFCAFGVTLSGEVVNVSANGIYIAANYEMAVGTALELAFSLPGEGGSDIRAQGRVAWINRDTSRSKDNLPAGFGVEFTAIADGELAAVKQFVAQHT